MKLCLCSSRGSVKGKVLVWDPSVWIQKSTSGGVTRAEIGNLFEDFKADLLNTLSSQITTIEVKKAQAEAEATLAIFCPWCKKKKLEREFGLNSVILCNICELAHSTNQCPKLPRLKAVLKESSEDVQYFYFIESKRPWKPWPTGMIFDFSSFYPLNNVYNSHKYPWQYPTPSSTQFPSPWNQWSSPPPMQYPPSQPNPWGQNWRINGQGPIPPPIPIQHQ